MSEKQQRYKKKQKNSKQEEKRVEKKSDKGRKLLVHVFDKAARCGFLTVV